MSGRVRQASVRDAESSDEPNPRKMTKRDRPKAEDHRDPGKAPDGKAEKEVKPSSRAYSAKYSPVAAYGMAKSMAMRQAAMCPPEG